MRSFRMRDLRVPVALLLSSGQLHRSEYQDIKHVIMRDSMALFSFLTIHNTAWQFCRPGLFQ